jgi:hypothetical protein
MGEVCLIAQKDKFVIGFGADFGSKCASWASASTSDWVDIVSPTFLLGLPETQCGLLRSLQDRKVVG